MSIFAQKLSGQQCWHADDTGHRSSVNMQQLSYNNNNNIPPLEIWEVELSYLTPVLEVALTSHSAVCV